MEDIEERMRRLGVFEEDLIEKFIQGSGPGGQNINKTASCVYLKHLPSGIEVKCQRTRSREQNRSLARRELCDRIEEKILGAESKKKREEAKIRKQKKRRSRKLKQKLIADKRQRGSLKTLRKPPGPEGA